MLIGFGPAEFGNIDGVGVILKNDAVRAVFESEGELDDDEIP
jgi:hypothetical protein